MQKIKCELCGRTSFTKTDNGLFMCDHCGCKYTQEQISIVISGAVETTIGQSELSRLITNAQAQLELGNPAVNKTIERLIQEYPASHYGYWFFIVQRLSNIFKQKWISHTDIIGLKEYYDILMKTISPECGLSMEEVSKHWEDCFVRIYNGLRNGQIHSI